MFGIYVMSSTTMDDRKYIFTIYNTVSIVRENNDLLETV